MITLYIFIVWHDTWVATNDSHTQSDLPVVTAAVRCTTVVMVTVTGVD